MNAGSTAAATDLTLHAPPENVATLSAPYVAVEGQFALLRKTMATCCSSGEITNRSGVVALICVSVTPGKVVVGPGEPHSPTEPPPPHVVPPEHAGHSPPQPSEPHACAP